VEGLNWAILGIVPQRSSKCLVPSKEKDSAERRSCEFAVLKRGLLRFWKITQKPPYEQLVDCRCMDKRRTVPALAFRTRHLKPRNVSVGILQPVKLSPEKLISVPTSRVDGDP
jgi:hypothetical protein